MPNGTSIDEKWLSYSWSTVSRNAGPDGITESDRALAERAFVQATQHHYQLDTQTVWYDSSGNIIDPPGQFGDLANNLKDMGTTDAGNYYEDAFLTYMDAQEQWITGIPENLSAEIGNMTMDEYAKKSYDEFLAKKAVADKFWLEKMAPPAEHPDSTQKEALDNLTDEAKQARDTAAAAATAAIQQEEATAPAGPSIPKAKSIKFKEQCFLLAKLFQLVKYKVEVLENEAGEEQKPLPYMGANGNACLMVHSDPFAFINRLVTYGTQTELITMSTEEISNLQPRIRLYKLIELDDGSESQLEYSFNSNAGEDIEDLLTTKDKRGFGVGIESFTIRYEGSDPYAAKRMIKGRLTLHANSFDEILKIRGSPTDPDKQYTYADLALKTGGSTGKYKEIKQNLTAAEHNQTIGEPYSLNFKLKAVFGWSAPNSVVGSARMEALINSFVTVNLQPTTHEFAFQDDGTVKFIINYQAWIDTHFNQKGFSVFTGTKSINANMIERKLRLQQLNEECDAENVAKFKREQIEKISEDRTSAVSSIIDTLLVKGRVRFIELPASQLKKFNTEGPFYELKNEELQIGTMPASSTLQEDVKEDIRPEKGAEEDGKLLKKTVDNPSGTNVSFFYVSDLIDAVLNNIEVKLRDYEELVYQAKGQSIKAGFPIDDELANNEAYLGLKYYNTFKKMRIVLGPMEIVNPSNPADTIVVSLGDLPISVKYFMEWMSGVSLQKDRRDFNLAAFVKKLIITLINSFINDKTCFSTTAMQPIRLREATFTAYNRGPDFPSDPITQLINDTREAKPKNLYISRLFTEVGETADLRPILNLSEVNGPGEVENEYHYLIFYASRARPMGLLTGDYETDLEQGIHHYTIGADRGIVKGINLVRDARPGVPEARYEAEKYDGLQQLRETYRVDMQCYANPHLFPGSYIFIDPKGWVPYLDPEIQEYLNVDNLTDFGIGGYYMVITAEHSFGPGQADTQVNANWVAQISRQKEDPAVAATNPQTKPKGNNKCAVGEKEDSPSGGNANREEPSSVSSGRLAGLAFIQDLMIGASETRPSPEDPPRGEGAG